MLQTQRSAAHSYAPQPLPSWPHSQDLPSSIQGSARFDVGLPSPVPSSFDDSSYDMTSFFAPSYQPAHHSDHDAFSARRADSRSDSKATMAFPYQSHPVGAHSSQPVSCVASRAASPEFQPAPSHDAKRGGSNSAIHPYLQLPATISPTGGSLTEFAAQTTCLFWFESSYTLARLEDTANAAASRPALLHTSRPTTGFLKWVTTILSTTQVTQNVVLLALLFVRRLKVLNPTVKGKPGSEYRLLTVALMLGNKFLDDNTYTNKTWAEVSGIAVSEIHVMEVEFLSHMKYNLYTTKEEWEVWHKQLANLWSFFNAPTDAISPPSKLSSSRPVLQIPRALPSPPGSNYASSPFAYSPSPALSSNMHTPQTAPHLAPPQLMSISPSSTFDAYQAPRKRSWDESAQASVVEPPSKKSFSAEAYASRASTPVTLTPGALPSSFPQLPSLPLPSFQAANGHGTQQGQSSLSTAMPSLPSSRPNSQVLPSVNWAHGLGAARNSSQHTIAFPTTPAYSERVGPGPNAYDTAQNRSSPAAAVPYSSAASHASSQHQMSPSFFLHQRSSPYKPVRDIRTLLGPAASGQLQSKPQAIPQEQMYWQPLGRHHERQAGRVPYLHREAWPETNQFEGWSTIQNQNHG